jgi:hypothetical protein
MLEQLGRCGAACVCLNAAIIIKGTDAHSIIQGVRNWPVAQVHGELDGSHGSKPKSAKQAPIKACLCTQTD